MKTISTTKLVFQSLGVNYRQYDNYREVCFTNWCKKYAQIYGLSLRAMIAHDGLRNWYHDQWLALVERSFAIDNRDYLQLEGVSELLIKLFESYPDKLLDVYPMTLLQILKKESYGIFNA